MFKKFIFAFFVLFFVCSVSGAAEKKMSVALVDFRNDTHQDIPVQLIMDVMKQTIISADIFTLIPDNEVKKMLESSVGFDAKARTFDAFSTARFGKALGADAVLIGRIFLFEKNRIPQEISLKISGYDFSRNGADVAIDVKLLDGKTGATIATATGSGKASEANLEGVVSFLTNTLSPAFLHATQVAALRLVNDLKGLLAVPIRPVAPAESPRFVITQIDKNKFYINAGRNRDISIGDAFEIYSNRESKVIGLAKIVELDLTSARLEVVGKTLSDVAIGDRAVRTLSGKSPKTEEKEPEKKATPQRRRKK